MEKFGILCSFLKFFGTFLNFSVHLNQLLISKRVKTSLAPLHSPKSAGALARWRFGHLLIFFLFFRQPLTNLQVNSAIRSSLSGKRSSIYGSSSNQIKDQRPISDKNWQNDVIRKLVDFCHENDYKNKALTFKDFRPMSTMTFRSIIEFLYGFLEPGFVLPSHAECPLHEALTELLKKLEYRGTVSKSHLQTLGKLQF